MKKTSKLLFAAIPLLTLAACGGDDAVIGSITEPQVRFGHISPVAPNVTLERNGSARSEATDIAYGFVSNYFNADTGNADWTVKVTSGGAAVGNVNFNAQRGNRYTILAVAESNSANSIVSFSDPTNSSPLSDDSRVRVFNGSFNAQSIDVYLIGLTQNIASLTPDLSGVGFKNAGPGSGIESLKRRGGTYQVVVTTAGSKTILFRGQFDIPDDRDVLFLTVPNAANPTGINLLVKIQGNAGAIQVPAI